MAMSASSLRSASAAAALEAGVAADGVDRTAATALGARLLLAGALGLIATCLGYVLAGPLAALPGGAPGMAAAWAATPAAAGWMRAAGLAGMPSDVLLAVGGLLLAAHEYRRGAALATAGWLALGVAGALFIVVDAMVALVLPAAAVQAGLDGYAGLRLLFDALFTIGAWTAGLGALAVAWQRGGLLWRLAWAGWLMRAAGVLGLVASTGHLAGLPGIAALIGPGIAVLAVALVGAALGFIEAA
jgi:hypothetical protein